MGVALAPAVAGRRHAHQPRVLAVLHVAGEDAVLDQHGAAGRRAFVVDRERAAALRQRAVVHHGDALRRHALAHQAGERRSLLAVEVAFETVADRFVQHHAGPAGAEHDVHLAGRRRHRVEIGERLAHRFANGVLPLRLVEERVEAFAPAVAVAAHLLAVAVADHDRDVDAHQRAHVAIAVAVGAQDFDHLPRRAERDRHLPHARILGARIGVDRLQELHLGFEGRLAERILVAVKLHIGARRRRRILAAIAAFDRTHRFRRARHRRIREIGGVGVADRFVLDRAQPETLGGVIGRLLETSVVERHHLGLAIFEEQFAVVGAFEATGEVAAGGVTVEAGAVEQRKGGGHVGNRLAGIRQLNVVPGARSCEGRLTYGGRLYPPLIPAQAGIQS